MITDDLDPSSSPWCALQVCIKVQSFVISLCEYLVCTAVCWSQEKKEMATEESPSKRAAPEPDETVPENSVRGWKAFWRNGETFGGNDFPGENRRTLYELNKTVVSCTKKPLYAAPNRDCAESWAQNLGLTHVAEVICWGEARFVGGDKISATNIKRAGELLPLEDRLRLHMTPLHVARALYSSMGDVKYVVSNFLVPEVDTISDGLTMYANSLPRCKFDLDLLDRVRYMFQAVPPSRFSFSSSVTWGILQSEHFSHWIQWLVSGKLFSWCDDNKSVLSALRMFLGKAIALDDPGLVRSLVSRADGTLWYTIVQDLMEEPDLHKINNNHVLCNASLGALSATMEALRVPRDAMAKYREQWSAAVAETRKRLDRYEAIVGNLDSLLKNYPSE